MENLITNYRKYRWFCTSSGKLVIGGKNADQNDMVLKTIKLSKKEFIIMHTSEPGSPFSIILEDVDKLTKSDLDETAIFTGCFSRAWRTGKKQAKVDIFLASKLYKSKLMKEGTWGVNEKLDSKVVDLKLALTKQNNILRAVPEITTTKKNILLFVCPGKIDKKDMLTKIQIALDEDLNQEELLSALPSGGVKICK